MISYKKLKFTKDISQTLFHLFQTNYRSFSLIDENAVMLEPFFIYVYFQMYTFEKHLAPKSHSTEAAVVDVKSIDIFQIFRNCLDDLLRMISENDSGMLSAKDVNHLAVFLCEERDSTSLNLSKAFPFWNTQEKSHQATNQSQRRKISDDRMHDPELALMARHGLDIDDDMMNHMVDDEVHDLEVNLSKLVDVNTVKNFILQNLERGRLPYQLVVTNVHANYVYYDINSARCNTYFEICENSDKAYICILQNHLQTVCVKNCKDCTIVLGVVRNMVHVSVSITTKLSDIHYSLHRTALM